MSLITEITTLDMYYSFPQLGHGYAETIEVFWNTFVEPRLPKKETVIAWHKLLMQYVKEADSVFVIRAFSNTNATARRGLLTRADAGFYFTYSDNGYAKLIAKMVYAGIIPQYEDFKHAMKTGSVPISEFMGSEEKAKSLYPCKGFDYAEYKLAHIIDAGQNFYFDGKETGLAKIVETYFPAGNVTDWEKETTAYIRQLKTAPEAKEILVAHFLRFVDPLNYFITPKPLRNGIAYHTSVAGDIAEYKVLQLYAMQKFSECYGSVYDDFLTLVKIPFSFMIQAKSGTNVGEHIVNVHWGANKGNNSFQGVKPPVPMQSKKQSYAARYSAPRLLFKRDIIESLSDDEVFIIEVTKNEPLGSYAMTKADFYRVFNNVVQSESYKKGGVYHYQKTPEKALQFLQ